MDKQIVWENIKLKELDVIILFIVLILAPITVCKVNCELVHKVCNLRLVQYIANIIWGGGIRKPITFKLHLVQFFK